MSFPDQDQSRAGSAIPRRILLVEDSTADIGLVREALQEHRVDCELTVILNGERAIQFVEEVENAEQPCPDLILVDLNLPRKSGREVIRRIRASGVCADVPLIVLTSSDSQRDKDDVAAFLPSRYIQKPTKLDDFVKLGAVFKQLLYPAT